MGKQWFTYDDVTNRLLGRCRVDVKQSDSEAICITGPMMSGKSLLAGNFLLQGLTEGSDALLVRFAEHAGFAIKDCDMYVKTESEADDEDFPVPTRANIPEKPIVHDSFEIDCPTLTEDTKLAVQELTHTLIQDSARVSFSIYDGSPCASSNVSRSPLPSDQKSDHPLLIELAFKPGALQPEVFVEIIRTVYLWNAVFRGGRNNIKRMALIQADAIGVSYPLLYNSSTAGRLFLPSLVHLVVSRGTDLIITAETGGGERATEMVRQVESLAERSIVCKYREVFGDRYITVTGPGMAEWELDSTGGPDVVPAVLWQAKDRSRFGLDFFTLDGLVGFESGDIRRPGVHMQFFEEGVLHKAYNDHIWRLVQLAMGTMEGENDFTQDKPTQVTMDRFDSPFSSTFHSSLNLLKDAPHHNTILRTVDEFEALQDASADFKSLEDKDEKRRHELEQILLYDSLYYRNVLLFACDQKTYTEIIQATGDQLIRATDSQLAVKHLPKTLEAFWEKISILTTPQPGEQNANVSFFIDTRASETFSCLLMDGVLCLSEKKALRRGENYTTNIRLNELPLDVEKCEIFAKQLIQVLPMIRALMDENPTPTNTLEDGPQRGECSPLSGDVLEVLKEKKGRFLILGWYTHIREMIKQALVESEKLTLAAKKKRQGSPSAIAISENLAAMKVLPLPGGGFTGDWYVKVSSNSVSRTLGASIQRQLLAPQEDFRRFIDGVGLPNTPSNQSSDDFIKNLSASTENNHSIWDNLCDCFKKLHSGGKKNFNIINDIEYIKKDNNFDDKIQAMALRDPKLLFRVFMRREDLKEFWPDKLEEKIMAWPGACVTLKEVLDIHRRANLRSRLKGYKSVRMEFAAIIEDLRRKSTVRATGISSNSTDNEQDAGKRTAELIVALLRRSKS